MGRTNSVLSAYQSLLDKNTASDRYDAEIAYRTYTNMAAIKETQEARRLELIKEFGSDNLITDDSGLLRPKSKEEGFDYSITPEAEKLVFSNNLQQQQANKQTALSVTLQNYFDAKKLRIGKAESLRKNYGSLSEEHLSGNFSTLLPILEDGADNTLKILQTNIDKLQTDIAALDNLEAEFGNQKQFYSTNEQRYVGVNTMIDPHEFEKLTMDYLEKEQKGEDYPTAGLYKAYMDNKPSNVERQRISKIAAGELKEEMKTIYANIQGVVAGDDFDIEVFGENESIQNAAIQSINLGNPSSFLRTLNKDKNLKEVYMKAFPIAMDNLLTVSDQVAQLNAEGEGILNDKDSDTIASMYREEINKTTSVNDAFTIFDEIAQTLTQDQQEDYFSVIEKKYGNQQKGYAKHLQKLNKSYIGGADYVSDTPSKLDDILLEYTDSEGNIDANLIFEHLKSPNALGISKGEYDHLSYPPMRDFHDEETKKKLFALDNFSRENLVNPISNVDRYDWDPGKAFGGGFFGTDSDWYNKFYDVFDDEYGKLVSEYDEFGWDRWIASGPLRFKKEEHRIPDLVEKEYPSEYPEILRKAIKAADLAQIDFIKQTIERGSGEDYTDLLHALNIIKD